MPKDKDATIVAGDGYDLLDRFCDPVVIFDAETLELTFLNSAAKQVAKSIQTDKMDFSKASDWCAMSQNQFHEKIKQNKTGGAQACKIETKLQDQHFQISISPWKLPNGNRGFCAVFHDITERVEIERVKQELASNVSHELRSPLTAITGAMGLALSGASGELPKGAEQLIQMAHRNADRLILIVNDMLDLDKMASGAMTFDSLDTNLSTIARDALDAIEGYNNRFEIAVSLEEVDADLYSHIDPNRMVQVLVNLLSNAIKFSPAKGKVIIKISRLGDLNRVSVVDFGEGIPKAEQDTLFKRFVQIGAQNRAKTGGTGLGLSIVKSIVEQLGGAVSVESELGKGTTFHVDLPRVTVRAINFANSA